MATVKVSKDWKLVLDISGDFGIQFQGDIYGKASVLGEVRKADDLPDPTDSGYMVTSGDLITHYNLEGAGIKVYGRTFRQEDSEAVFENGL